MIWNNGTADDELKTLREFLYLGVRRRRFRYLQMLQLVWSVFRDDLQLRDSCAVALPFGRPRLSVAF
jgi:hypothetical protein